MGTPGAPPPSRFNFAQHLLATQRRPRGKARLRRRRADAYLRRTRGRASRGWRTRSRRSASGARSACSSACTTPSTSRSRSWARCMRASCRCGQHAAHRRRLRVHARAQPRAGARRVRRVAADARAGDGARGARGAARRRVASGGRARRRRARRSTRCWPRSAAAAPMPPRRRSPTTSRSGSIRRARPDGPKGTVHTHGNLYWTAELYGRRVLGVREDDVVFSAAKLFFAYGLGNALTFPLLRRAPRRC